MSTVRLGIIGLGNMGSSHCRSIQKMDNITLTAVADVSAARCEKVGGRYEVPAFEDYNDLLNSKLCDAVLIATPHYDHTTIGQKALRKGLHVMVEKPVSVHKADAERLIKAHTNEAQVFAAMFNQRTNPGYQKIRELITDGSLGQVRRIQWTITDWFRSESYYASGGWRATWGGEGGGVLLNQCPHQLDLLQWMFGMPQKVRAFCNFGKYHNIEVEDEVTAYLEYENGATGVFTTTTGEAPGSNRLEVSAENGFLVFDTSEAVIRIDWNEKSISQAIVENDPFEKPATRREEIPVDGEGGQHREILENFADAVLDGAALIAPAGEGINSVELANAMLLSGWTEKTVALPINARGYERRLKQRIADSTFTKEVKEQVVEDMSSSF